MVMVVRGSGCPLCGQAFERRAGDVIAPERAICDACLQSL